MDFNSVITHTVPFTHRFKIPEEVLVDSEMTTWIDDIMRSHWVEFKSEILAMDCGEVEARSEPVKISISIDMRVPATWWDAFKLHAIEVSGNPFFNPKKIKWKVERRKRTDTVTLITKAISADLHPDRNFRLPPDKYGKPIQVFLNPYTEVERT